MNKLQRICSWCKKDIDTGNQLTDEKYTATNKVATHGICPECEAKENKQMNLFDVRLGSLPINDKREAGGHEQPASPSNGKITFNAADLESQLREMCEGNHIKVKTNLHQDIAVNIRSTDKGDTITVNPKRWRGTNKTKTLTQFIFEAVANNYG